MLTCLGRYMHLLKLCLSRKSEVLKQTTRVIDSVVVNFYIVKITYKLFGGLIVWTSKKLHTDYFADNFDLDDAQTKIEWGIRAAAYQFMYQEHELMTKIEE